jgi:hypothetical protein
MNASAAFLLKNSIYMGGEMAAPSFNKSAFLIKFNTQTNSITWQRHFHYKLC